MDLQDMFQSECDQMLNSNLYSVCTEPEEAFVGPNSPDWRVRKAAKKQAPRRSEAPRRIATEPMSPGPQKIVIEINHIILLIFIFVVLMAVELFRLSQSIRALEQRLAGHQIA